MELYKRVLKFINWKEQETKYIIILSTLVIGIITTILCLVEPIIFIYQQATEQSQNFQLSIYNLDKEEMKEILQLLETDDEIEYATGISGECIGDVKGSSMYINLIGATSSVGQTYPTMEMTEGKFPQNENEIAIDIRYIENVNGNCEIGESINIEFYHEASKEVVKKDFVICGYIDFHVDTITEAHAVTTIEGTEMLTGENDYSLLVETMYKSIEDVGQYYVKLHQKLKEKGYPICEIQSVEQQTGDLRLAFNSGRFNMEEEYNSNLQGVVRVVRMLGIMIAVCALFVLFNLQQVSATNSIRHFGLLRAIGMNKKQLLFAIGLKAILNIMIAGAAGLIISVVLTYTAGSFIAKDFYQNFRITEAMSEITYQFSARAFVGAYALVAGILLLSYVILAYRIVHNSILNELVFHETKIRKKFSIRKRKSQKLIVLLAQRNIKRNRFRSFYTLITLCFANILLMTMVITGINLDFSNVPGLKRSSLGSMAFFINEVGHEITNEMAESIQNFEGVEELYLTGEVRDFEDDVIIRVVNEPLLKRILVDNKLKDLDLTKPIILLKAEESRKADEPYSCYYKNSGKKVEVNLTGYYKENKYLPYLEEEGKVILINEAAYTSILKKPVLWREFIVQSDNKDLAKRSIQEYFKEKQFVFIYTDLDEIKNEALEQLKSIMRISTFLFGCFVIFTVANLGCTVKVNAKLRQKEYGMMNAIGLSHKDTVKLLTYEMKLIIEYSLIIGTIISLVLSMIFTTGCGCLPVWSKTIIGYIILICGLYLASSGICNLIGKQELSKTTVQLLEAE